VTKEAKHRVIEKLLAGAWGSKIVRNFLFVDRGQSAHALLPEMIAAFQEVDPPAARDHGAQVSSAVD